MVYWVLLLIPWAMTIAFPTCWALVRMGHRLGTLDGPGVAGQVKEAPRRVPNTGGIAIVAAFVLPVLLIVGIVAWGVAIDPRPISISDNSSGLPGEVRPYVAGIVRRTPLVLVFLGSVLALHIVGLIDDRRPLGPWVKLVAILAASTAIALTDQTRLLTMLDSHVGGAWLSILVSVLWIAAVTNAFNFMDNMDGLAGGTAFVASACFFLAAMVNGQWFIAGLLGLLIGALAAFLVFNFPPARLFMGDSGSLVIGFILAVLTVRTTYYAPPGMIVDGRQVAPAGAGWHTVFMPLVILAVPLYDLGSVVLIRLAQGRSPLVGDLQHFSHRLVGRGLSKRAAVLVIWGFTLVTGISGIMLATLEPWQGALVGVQTMAILGVIAAFEYASSARHKRAREARAAPDRPSHHSGIGEGTP